MPWHRHFRRRILLQWNKAKIIIIILLVVVNVVLFTISLSEGRASQLSPNQMDAVLTLLNDDDINIDRQLFLSARSQLSNLNATPRSIDTSQVLAIFPSEYTEVAPNIFTNNEGQFITFTDTSFTYDNYNDMIYIDFSRGIEYAMDYALDTAHNFFNTMGSLANGFYFDSINVGPNFIQAIYRSSHNGIVLYNSEIRITITQSGIRSIEYMAIDVDQTTNTEQLAPLDEVLFKFMVSVPVRPITVNLIDIVYHGVDELVPAFRIIYNDHFDFLIEANTNRLIAMLQN